MPDVIQTKENLLAALRTGDIKTSKYNLLNEEEKLFVELIVFGDYSAEQAMRHLHGERYYKGMGTRLISRPNVAEALEELSYKKNVKYMAEISNARDMALRKLTYIMSTTQDESVAAACAKTILDKAERATEEKKDTNIITGITFNITPAPEVIDLGVVKTVDNSDKFIFEAEYYDETPEEKKPNESGLEFTLNYSSIDNY